MRWSQDLLVVSVNRSLDSASPGPESLASLMLERPPAAFPLYRRRFRRDLPGMAIVRSGKVRRRDAFGKALPFSREREKSLPPGEDPGVARSAG